MKDKIEKFLLDNRLAVKDCVIAVGFSGGFDSMALLNVINELSGKYKFKVIAVHLNHNWRGKESLKEQENCKSFCLKKNIEFYTETLDKCEKHTETRARELRYKFFNDSIAKYNANALLTAHTKSDTSETLIYRIIKGTGIRGLQGISPKLGKIYRPMLDISRVEVEQYCKENNLNPNFDSSNKNNHYARNFIRNEIIPLFKNINNKVENAINSLAGLAFEEEQLINEYIASLNLFYEDKIYTQKFKELSYLLQKRLIYNFYVKYDFEYTQERVETVLKFILENINSKSGKTCSIDSEHWFFVNIDYICVICSQEKNENIISINSEGRYLFGDYIFTIEKCSKIPDSFPKDSEYKAFVEINSNIDFTLRTRKNGDVIRPLGCSYDTKLKKYLINKSVPCYLKDKIILLCKDGEILWVSGYGLSDKIKVVKRCTHVLTLEKIGGTLC